MNKYSIYRTIISNSSLLSAYLIGSFPSQEELENHTFQELHKQNMRFPDYAIHKTMEMAFNGINGFSNKFIHSLEQITDHFLYSRNSSIYVREEHFSEWQHLLTDIPPLILLSSHLYKSGRERNELELDSFANMANRTIKKTAYPSIYSPQLNQLIDDEGLNERHMHLNGSIESDTVWLDALKNPLNFYESINSGYKKGVKEQYLKMGNNFTPRTILNLLKLCGEIRNILIEWCESSEEPKITEELVIKSLHSCNGSYTHLIEDYPRNNQIPRYYPQLEGTNERVLESLFYIRVFQVIENSGSNFMARLLHIYLLTTSQINRLLVQQRDQFGFDQFQKITDNECREESEQGYLRRFLQLEGMYGEDIKSLEGRFAPKKNAKGTLKRLKPLFKDYDTYKRNHSPDAEEPLGPKRMDLSLVGHFIKKNDNRRKKEHTTMGRHRGLRFENRSTMRGLIRLAEQNRKVREYLKGFDAAANELHAPPEVYAPAFRYLKYNGFENYTFHVGEDYIHLLSGIRAIFEAITFLDLSSGNRIGHGTALGINPDIWKSRSLVPAVMTKGEWHDNLLFAWSILSKPDSQFHSILPIIKEQIHGLTTELYGSSYPIDVLLKAWKLRDIDPLIALDENFTTIIPFNEIELEDINRRKFSIGTIEVPSWKVFELYHSDVVISKSEQLFEVEDDPFTSEIFESLQKYVLNLFVDKNIAIETLPTSNVRISYYEDHSEHHLPVWLGHSSERTDYPKPSVVVGTDDSGIFATNLRNEFAHIFLILTKECGLSNDDAYEEIKKLNRNGEMFSFR
jgi:adenosine deaminase